MTDDDDGGRSFPVHRPPQGRVLTGDEARAAAARFAELARRIRHLADRTRGGDRNE